MSNGDGDDREVRVEVEPEEIEVHGSYVRLDEPTLADAARRLRRLEAVRDRIAEPHG